MFKNLNPWPYVAAGLVGVILGGLAYGRLVEPGNIDDARREEAERQAVICRDTTNTAARAAEEEARRRERSAAETAQAALSEAARMRDAQNQIRLEKLEVENETYQTQLVAAGRACYLDRSDIERLRGQPAR